MQVLFHFGLALKTILRHRYVQTILMGLDLGSRSTVLRSHIQLVRRGIIRPHCHPMVDTHVGIYALEGKNNFTLSIVVINLSD